VKYRLKFGTRMAHRHTQNEEDFDNYDPTPYEVKRLVSCVSWSCFVAGIWFG
jgi:hypothetical protein